IALAELQGLIAVGAQLLEVLPEQEFADAHLPGAINIPLPRLTAQTAGVLDRERALVVYCWDGLCDMSPRAACRLDALGFAEVYDYVAGKADWLAHGLPVEGEQADAATAGRAAREEVVTCRPQDPVGPLR